MRSRPIIVATVAVLTAIAAAGCGGGPSLSAAAEAWCLDNFDAVDEAADARGGIDLVAAYYDLQGGGVDDSGEPIDNQQNRDLSDDLFARADEDVDALEADLRANYLEHPDGVAACEAAYAAGGG